MRRAVMLALALASCGDDSAIPPPDASAPDAQVDAPADATVDAAADAPVGCMSGLIDGQRTAPCTLVLSMPPSDSYTVSVEILTQLPLLIPRDRMDLDGWDLDASLTVITVYGSYCQMLVDDPSAMLIAVQSCLPTVR